MNQKDGQIIFVTIGLPFSRIPIMQKVMLFVSKEIGNPIEVAKMLREEISHRLPEHGYTPGPNFRPSELYYEIYGEVDNTVPFAMSFNSPYRRTHVRGELVDHE
jgi:hypothetical protein